MKQYITVKQLNELSEKGKLKLKHWMVKNNYLEFEDTDNWSIVEKEMFISIGMMIEFLGNRYLKAIRWGYGVVKNEDICDALWQPVKEVLEK